MNLCDWREFVLVLVDVQHDFWTDDMAQSHPNFPHNVAQLLTFCRTEGLDIVHLRASFQPNRSGWMVRYKLRDTIPCIEGTAGFATLPFAHEQPGEPVFAKQTFDGFHNPALLAHLHAHGKRFVLVAGLITSVCVLLTAASAAQRGFLTAIIEDCSADRSDMHDHVLNNYPFIFERTTLNALPTQHQTWCSQLGQLPL